MNAERLLTLAAHLKSDRRGHKIFDFRFVTSGLRDEERHGCGTAGCALGELPVVWPDAWDFGEPLTTMSFNYSVRLKSQDWSYACGLSAHSGACEWFELSEDEVSALFYANKILAGISPIQALPNSATAKQVADRFIAFVKWREEQEHLQSQDNEGSPQW